MAEKQTHLNGAYYGPNIPPPKQYYHRPGRGGDCCGCCCGCIFSLICKLIVTAVIIIGIAVLVFWLVVRPNMVKFHVTDAKLTQFDYTNNTLQYNLAINMTIRNPNRRIGIYYDSIEARASYEDERFSTRNLSPFYQGTKNTSYLKAEFNGQQLLLLDAEETSELSQQKNAGVYNIDVKLYLKIRYKIGEIKVGKFKPKIKCDLKVPLSTNGTSVSGFQTTKCDIDI